MFLSLADSGTAIWNLDIKLRFVKNVVRYIEDFVKQEVPLYMTKFSLFSQLKESLLQALLSVCSQKKEREKQSKHCNT